MLRAIVDLDVRIARAIAARRVGWLTRFFVVLTWSGSGFVWFGLAAILFATLRLNATVIPTQSVFLDAMRGALYALLSGSVIKRLAKRRRPYAAHPDIPRGAWAPGDNHSFPSSHASTSATLAIKLWILGHPFAPYVTGWAMLISFSRLYLSVHYASDVAAGIAIGLVCGVLAP